MRIRRAAQRIADERGTSFSAVVTEALTRWIRGRLVDAWLAEHQARHGQFDENELRELAVDAGVPYAPWAGRRFGRVNLVLDAGALIAIDRDDRRTAGPIELGRRSGAALVTAASVVGQAWRGSARQGHWLICWP